MTRKKFVKMLMANGTSRAAANQAASMAREMQIPYFKALGNWLNFFGLFDWAVKRMTLDTMRYGQAEVPSIMTLNPLILGGIAHE